MSDSKVKVAVRVRPMNRREIELNTKCVVDMEDNQTVLHPPPSNAKGESRKQPKVCMLHSFLIFLKSGSNSRNRNGRLHERHVVIKNQILVIQCVVCSNSVNTTHYIGTVSHTDNPHSDGKSCKLYCVNKHG
nr:uncharacterized protein LOC107390243 [Nothobranchius furzeri]